jgi:hypothetical protein
MEPAVTPADNELGSQLEILKSSVSSELGMLIRRLAILKGFEARRAGEFAAAAMDSIRRINVDLVVADEAQRHCPKAGCCRKS